MVKAKKRRRARKAVVPKPECVTIGTDLRKLHKEIDEAAQPKKNEAVQKRRKALRKKGRELSERRLKQVSDALERVQRLLNPLDKRSKRLKEIILAHYGHDRISEIIGKLGNAQIKEQFTLAEEDVDAILNNDKLTDEQRKLITKKTIDIEAAYALAKTPGGEELMKILLTQVKVSKFMLSVYPPSSRTPNTGEQKEDLGDDEE